VDVCRYFQYDSWFYQKDEAAKKGDGVITWDAMPSVFPHGMEFGVFSLSVTCF